MKQKSHFKNKCLAAEKVNQVSTQSIPIIHLFNNSINLSQKHKTKSIFKISLVTRDLKLKVLTTKHCKNSLRQSNNLKNNLSQSLKNQRKIKF